MGLCLDCKNYKSCNFGSDYNVHVRTCDDYKKGTIKNPTSSAKSLKAPIKQQAKK